MSNINMTNNLRITNNSTLESTNNHSSNSESYNIPQTNSNISTNTITEDSPIYTTLMNLSIELRAISICIENAKRPLHHYKYHSDDNVMPKELYIDSVVNTSYENISYIDEKKVSYYADQIDKIIAPNGWGDESYRYESDYEQQMEDDTIYSLGHLSMNPKNEPFLGPEA
jgi:hypothetical protein